MSIRYNCKHCDMHLGEIADERISELQLGFHFLTPAERRDIITYDSNGDTLVKISCEFCMEALRIHPELALVPNPLQ
jgi:hypothetical protein